MPAAQADEPVGRGPAQAEAPGAVRLQILDRQISTLGGFDGIVLAVARDDGHKTEATVTVEVDYSKFANAYGGDWASRLRLVALPDCTAKQIGRAGACQTHRPMPTSNDLKAGVVAAARAAECRRQPHHGEPVGWPGRR